MKVKWKAKKWVYILLGAILVFIGGALFITIILKKRIEQKITHLLPGQQITLSSVQPHWLHSSVTLNNMVIHLKADTLPQNHSPILHFARIEITGINILPFITQKKLFADKVIIDNSDIKINEQLLRNKEYSLEDELANVQTPFTQLSVKELQVTHATVWLLTAKKDVLLLQGNMVLHQLNINGIGKSLHADSIRLASFDCHLQNVNYPLPDATHILHINTLTANSHRATIQIDSLSIHPKTGTTRPVKKPYHSSIPIRATIAKILMNGVDFSALLHEKILADKMLIIGSRIQLSDVDRLLSASKNKIAVDNYLKSIPITVSVKKLALQDLSLEGSEATNDFGLKGNITVYQFNTHPGKLRDKESFYFRALDFSLSAIHASIPHSLYNISIGHIRLDSRKGILSLSGLKLIPKFSKLDFSRKSGYQSDRIEAAVSQVTVSHPDITELLRKGNKLYADEVVINDCHVHIFRDRRLPRRLKSQPLPVAYLRTLPFDIRINSITVKNSSVVYEEYPEQGQQTGTIAINNLRLSIAPFLNHPTSSDPAQLLLKTEGSIMNSGRVYVNILMPLRSNEYAVTGAIQNLNLTSLNNSSQNLGAIKIKSGLLDSLGFDFTFTDQKATGKIVGIYHHLIIQPLKKVDANGTKKVAKLKSFMLRHFIIPLNKDRTVPIAKRTGKIDYPRDPTRFISYYMLQALLTGIKSSFTLGFLLPK